VWHMVDFCCFILMGTWQLCYNSSDPLLVDYGHISLNLSAVLLSFGMLRYMSLSKTLGQLTLTLITMGYDLR